MGADTWLPFLNTEAIDYLNASRIATVYNTNSNVTVTKTITAGKYIVTGTCCGHTSRGSDNSGNILIQKPNITVNYTIIRSETEFDIIECSESVTLSLTFGWSYFGNNASFCSAMIQCFKI